MVTEKKMFAGIPLKEGTVNILPNLEFSLSEAKERGTLLQHFVKELLIDGVDYGIFEGFQKPTLLKSGAEKLCDIFGLSKHVKIINYIENWDKGIFAYVVKVILINKNSGRTEAEGIGTCNSKEKLFIDQDPFSIVNTLLKMAEKRALIDAVLSATSSSGIFTQDIEDFYVKQNNKEDHDLATSKQLKKIHCLIKEVKMQYQTAKEWMKLLYKVDRSIQLTKKQASSFIQELESLKPIIVRLKE